MSTEISNEQIIKRIRIVLDIFEDQIQETPNKNVFGVFHTVDSLKKIIGWYDKLEAIREALNTPNTGNDWFVQQVIQIMNLHMDSKKGWVLLDE